MIALILAWLRYQWHKRVLTHETQALIFMGHYTRLQCLTCGHRFWQMPGLMGGRRVGSRWW